MTSNFLKGVALSAAAFVASIGGAQASTIMGTGTTLSITCSGGGSCMGFVGGSLNVGPPMNSVQSGSMASLSGSMADFYGIGQNSPTNEQQALDILLDGIDNDNAPAGAQTAGGGVEMLSFTTSAEFVAIKTGAGHLFLALSGIGPVTIDFSAVGVNGGGLSHYTEFGQLSAVPVPAAGLMLLAGLGGIGAMRRRKKAA